MDNVVDKSLPLGETIAFGVIAGLGIMGNGLVIFVLTHMVKSRKGNANILIVNQSLIDLTTSVMLILCCVVPDPDLPASPAAARLLCSVWNSKYPFWATIITSTFNLVALTLERYYAIVHPFKYRSCTLFNWPKSLLLAVIPWVAGYSYQSYFAAMHYADADQCVMNSFPSKAAQVVYAIIILMVTYLLPLLIMTFAYVRIYKTMKTDSISIITAERTSMHISSTITKNPNDHENERAIRNIVKTLIFVYVVFGLCWAPNQVFYFYYNVSDNHHISETLNNVGVCLAFLNMCANPFIYTFKYRKFREGLQRAMPCLARLTRVSDLSPLRADTGPAQATSSPSC